MKTPHAFSAILQAIAAGEQVQWRHCDESSWSDQGADCTLREIIDEDYPANCYRVKPDCIKLGGFEIPRPMLSAPAIGTNYWFISTGSSGGICGDTWDSYDTDTSRLASGMCWLTKDDALQAAASLTSILKGE